MVLLIGYVQAYACIPGTLFYLNCDTARLLQATLTSPSYANTFIRIMIQHNFCCSASNINFSDYENYDSIQLPQATLISPYCTNKITSLISHSYYACLGGRKLPKISWTARVWSGNAAPWRSVRCKFLLVFILLYNLARFQFPLGWITTECFHKIWLLAVFNFYIKFLWYLFRFFFFFLIFEKPLHIILTFIDWLFQTFSAWNCIFSVIIQWMKK